MTPADLKATRENRSENRDMKGKQEMTFEKGFGRYVCEGDTIETEIDGFTVTATVYRDDVGDAPDERDDGFWPSRDPKAAGYVLPENFEAERAKAEKVMAAWKNDEWFYCGVAVTVSREGVALTGRYDHALWGVECNYPDSDNEYLREVAGEYVGEALAAARAKIRNLCAAVS
jgi:hypothetical protein